MFMPTSTDFSTVMQYRRQTVFGGKRHNSSALTGEHRVRWQIIIAKVITLILALFILLMKIRAP